MLILDFKGEKMQLLEDVFSFVDKILDARLEDNSRATESLEIQSKLLLKADIERDTEKTIVELSIVKDNVSIWTYSFLFYDDISEEEREDILLGLDYSLKRNLDSSKL